MADGQGVEKDTRAVVKCGIVKVVAVRVQRRAVASTKDKHGALEREQGTERGAVSDGGVCVGGDERFDGE